MPVSMVMKLWSEKSTFESYKPVKALALTVELLELIESNSDLWLHCHPSNPFLCRGYPYSPFEIPIFLFSLCTFS